MKISRTSRALPNGAGVVVYALSDIKLRALLIPGIYSNPISSFTGNFLKFMSCTYWVLLVLFLVIWPHPELLKDYAKPLSDKSEVLGYNRDIVGEKSL